MTDMETRGLGIDNTHTIWCGFSQTLLGGDQLLSAKSVQLPYTPINSPTEWSG